MTLPFPTWLCTTGITIKVFNGMSCDGGDNISGTYTGKCFCSYKSEIKFDASGKRVHTAGTCYIVGPISSETGIISGEVTIAGKAQKFKTLEIAQIMNPDGLSVCFTKVVLIC